MRQCGKRWNFIIKMLLCLLLGVMSFLYAGTVIGVKAAEEKPTKSLDGNWEYLTNEDGTITTSDYLGKLLWVSVPLQIDGKAVRAVGERTFEGCKDVTSIVIPNGIKEIGNFAFNDCSKLSYIGLPDTITEIADFSFDDCTSLTSITIPNSVTKIGVCAFYGCSSLQSIVLPDGVTSIGNRAFSRCKELNSITIPASVVSIGELTFEGNSSSLMVYTTAGSFAEKYAKDKNIAVQIIEPDLPTPTPMPTPDINTPTTPQPEKQAQVIQAKSFTKTYGSKAFSLNAATSGNGKLSYTVANKKIVTVNSAGKVAIKGCGKTTVTIKASETARYQSATKKVSITILPKKVSVIKAFSSAKGKISFSWKKDNTVTGYEIYVDRYKDFREMQSMIFKKNKTSIVVSGAKSKVKYYLKIRAYKMCGKTKYYSKWSTVKKVTVK